MKAYIKLIRLKHSIKNVLIFLPLLFSGLLFDNNNIITSILGAIIFTMVSSSIYIINDIKDVEKDKKHPTKRKRPIASGEISIINAWIYFACLLTLSIVAIIMLKLSLYSIIFLALYFIINIGYSFGLKNVPLVDIAILVSGFVIRVLYGASLLNIEVSNWLLLTILTLSFYMGLGKRRNEVAKCGKTTRKVLKFYTKEFLDKNMYMFLACSIVFYALWSVSSDVVSKGNNLVVWTVPIVIMITMKYSMDVEGDSDGDPVEVILKDKALILLGIGYAITIFLIMYVIH